jgi:hypothetical protein
METTAHESRASKHNSKALIVSAETTYEFTPAQKTLIKQTTDRPIYPHDDPGLRKGTLNGTIPSAIVDSGASSHVGTTNDPFVRTNQKSNKIFRLPDGSTQAATDIGLLPYNVRHPAREVHITPGIQENSLVSTSKFADAG